MRGCYHVNERVCSTQDSRWWGAVIMWIRECSLHTTAADEGLLSCKWESVLYTRQPLMRGWYRVNEWGAKWLCFAHSRTPLEVGAACLDSGFFRAASPAKWDPGLMSCPAGSTVRGIWTFIRHELITWVPKVHRWSEGRRTTFKKMSYSPERCRGAAMRPALEWASLTVSCNSLSHNLGSAKWRKRFWRNCRGRRIYTASRARHICMLRDNWPVIWTGVSQ